MSCHYCYTCKKLIRASLVQIHVAQRHDIDDKDQAYYETVEGE